MLYWVAMSRLEDDLGETKTLAAMTSRPEREKALADCFLRHRPRLRAMVQLRLDRRLQGRMDPSDVLQDAFVEVVGRLEEFLRGPPMPLFLWLRLVTGQKILSLHRLHLQTRGRDARREAPRGEEEFPEASSAALSAGFVGDRTSPSQRAIRKELQARVQDALERLDPVDREVLALRHFEDLSNVEAARILGLKETAASQRYVRAMERLRKILPKGLLEERSR
jgi:RNA polymerase sigma-70 factor (ECF subfamily)